jgi:uncharacterized membrane protein HdeD (DUF308 family)
MSPGLLALLAVTPNLVAAILLVGILLIICGAMQRSRGRSCRSRG